jgi:DNA-binding IclR family transcriptional regulator
MANKPIAMSKLKTLIRLHIESASKSKISRSTGLSRNTVKTYLQKLESLPLSPADFLALQEHDFYQLLQQTLASRFF